MLRNILAAALRNLGRNGLYAAITILGLTLGLATAILIGLFVRDEFSYDRFIPGYRDVYTITETLTSPSTGLAKRTTGFTPSGIAGSVLPGIGRQVPS